MPFEQPALFQKKAQGLQPPIACPVEPTDGHSGEPTVAAVAGEVGVGVAGGQRITGHLSREPTPTFTMPVSWNLEACVLLQRTGSRERALLDDVSISSISASPRTCRKVLRTTAVVGYRGAQARRDCGSECLSAEPPSRALGTSTSSWIRLDASRRAASRPRQHFDFKVGVATGESSMSLQRVVSGVGGDAVEAVEEEWCISMSLQRVVSGVGSEAVEESSLSLQRVVSGVSGNAAGESAMSLHRSGAGNGEDQKSSMLLQRAALPIGVSQEVDSDSFEMLVVFSMPGMMALQLGANLPSITWLLEERHRRSVGKLSCMVLASL